MLSSGEVGHAQRTLFSPSQQNAGRRAEVSMDRTGLDILQDTCDFLDEDWIWIFIFVKI